MTPALRALWLKERTKSLGASEVSALIVDQDGMPVSPYGGHWNVWAEKRGLTAGAVESIPMRVGTFLEPLVADLVAERWEGGATIDEVAFAADWTDRTPRAMGIIRPPGNEWAHASPDRFVLLPGRDTPGVMQIKTSGSGEGWGPDGADADADTVPPHVLLQTLWEMWCVSEYFAPFTPIPEPPMGWIAVLIRNSDLRIYPVRWDAERMAPIIAHCREWWHRHIVQGEAPPIDGSKACSDALAWLVPSPTPGVVELPESAGDLIEAKDLWTARGFEAHANARLARNKLVAMLGESARGLCWAGGKRKMVTHRGGRLSVSAARADARATAGEPDYADAIPLGAFGEVE